LLKKQTEDITRLQQFKERELNAFNIGDAISDGICVTDGEGIVTAINTGYTEITGIQESEIVGQNIQILLDRGLFNNAVSLQVLEQKKKITSLATINKINKKVLITGNPSFDESGKINQVLTVMRDLTELVKLRNNLEEMERRNEKYLDELNYLRNQYKEDENIIGENKDIKKLKELISYIGKTDTTVLITGETGCGKEVFAREVHNKSNRKDCPYVKVNCAAIPESLIESELFGYEKGAFTGALNKNKLGMFETANGGTILLDEIGEMPLNLQSKLLRVIQEKEIMRIGATQSIKLDVRVIAATNQNLSELIKIGKFREDLFYRLNVVPIRIPPLRERKDDISILAYKFLKKFNIKYTKDKGFDNTAMQAFEYYDWPGNVRELENVIERLIVVDDNSYITYNDISIIIGTDKIKTNAINSTLTLREAVDKLEREMIENALRKFGSTYKAANVLGVTQPTVFRKAKALGVKLTNV
jgi:PAS domain S-box-containing protein